MFVIKKKWIEELSSYDIFVVWSNGEMVGIFADKIIFNSGCKLIIKICISLFDNDAVCNSANSEYMHMVS